ncbi:MAG: DUF4159 domain-containing protein [Acidobacteriota bacterium]
MTRQRTALLTLALFLCAAFLYAQKPFQQYRDTAEDYSNYPLPADYDKPAEFVIARLKYRDVQRFKYGRDLYWTMDYPRGDRHLAQGLRRLTNLDVRSVEQVTEADGSDDIYNWPFLYAVEVGMWDLTEDQAAQIKKFLDRGGFLMVDDFHGDPEWENFQANMDLISPNYDIVDLDVRDTIFHTVSDVNELIQIPSAQYMGSGLTYEKEGRIPHFRAVRDARGRIIVVICHNMDFGDAIENSDEPQYPERFSALAYRMLTNYVVYSLSH